MGGQRLLDDANLADYFAEAGVVPHDSALEVSPAGDGNINWVRRVCEPRSTRSWVVKQARPALEAFPEYEVSTERICFEHRYYEVCRPLDGEGICPRIHLFDAEQRILVLEDLTDAERLDAALARGADVTAAAASLGQFLGRVHTATGDGAQADRFPNDEMRRLHGDHIFHLPYRDNDFPLSAAVAERAAAIRGDSALVGAIDAAYSRYLDTADVLVHADVQPTNVLLAASGPKLLDAEIAHCGDPAFDVGIFVAHLAAAAIARGDASTASAALHATWSSYTAARDASRVPFRDVARYAGIELLRRTLGAARMPGVERDDVALAVLDAGVRLVRSPPDGPAGLA